MISCDDALDIARPTAAPVAALGELMQLNPQRPSFLLMHVRESTTIEPVAPPLLGRLSEQVEVVPLDPFLKRAAGAKTHRRSYPPPTDPIDRTPLAPGHGSPDP